MPPKPELAVVAVPIAKLHANAWNPNRQNEATQRAEVASIDAYGFIDPITVRPHPTLTGEYEIIDGEHRWLACQTLGIDAAPCVVLKLDDAQAKKLTVVMNETRGDADAAALGELLAELNTIDPGLLAVLPWDGAELESLILPALPAAAAPTASEPEDWFTLRARLPADFADVWESVVRKAAEAGVTHSDEKVLVGQIIELLSAEYLAGL